MRKVLMILCLPLFLCFSIESLAQEKAEKDNSQTKTVSEIFNYKSSTSNYLILNQVEAPKSITQNPTINSRNITIINQVGNNNTAVSQTSTENSTNLNYLQNGNNNNINSSNFIVNSVENIIQRGDNNNFRNFSFGNIDTSSLNILQEGNNLTFEKFGTNSLTNKISLKTIGDNKTIIIRSF